MGVRRVRIHRIAATLALAGALGAGAPDAGAAAADSLRGTERPVPRRVSPVRHAARAILFVPYVGVRVVTWPVEQIAEAEDRYHAVSRLAQLLRPGFESGQFSTALNFGFESSSGLSIIGFEAAVRDWPAEGGRMRLGAGYLSDDNNMAGFTFRGPATLLRWEGLVVFENRTQRRFYGLGPHSPDEDFEADRQRLLAQLGLGLHPGDHAKVALTGYTRRDHLDSPDDDPDESVAVGFPGEFSIARESHYHGAELELAWDARDRPAFAMAGSLVRLIGGWNGAESQGDADYRHWSGEVQTFLPLWRGNRVLGLRAILEGIDTDRPGDVPYTEQVRLGGKNGLRGYARDRFADQTGLLLNAEYRYPVTKAVFGSLFVDWGTVAPRVEDLRLADVDPSVGLGLAYVLGPAAFRMHVARSPEGFEFYLGSDSLIDGPSRRLR